MIRYRPFLNTDVPLIVEIWRNQPRITGLFSALAIDQLDMHVLSKPYFDSRGLILALEDQGNGLKPLGFVHVGFAPQASMNELDLNTGIVSQLKVVPGEQAAAVAAELLKLGMEQLKNSGATVAHAGSKYPHSPFYLGLYGGSRVPGVLSNDDIAIAAFRAAGFHTDDTVKLMERNLAGFRPLMDRDQMAVRRQYQIITTEDPEETSWWECCLFSMAERERFSLSTKNQTEPAGSVSYWDMLPIATEAGTTCRGLYDLHVSPSFRGKGLATFLVSESLKILSQRGVGQVEVQVRQSDQASLKLFEKLGFETVAQAFQMSRPL